MKRKLKTKVQVKPEKASTKLILQIKDIKALEKDREYVGKPFGFMWEEWAKLKAKIQKSDQLWWLVTKQGKDYHWGYGIVRNKKVVGKIIVEESKGDCYGVFND
jgi:hypothetical protein